MCMSNLPIDAMNTLQEISLKIDKKKEQGRSKYGESEPNTIIISSEMFYELQESFDMQLKEGGFSLFGMKVIVNEYLPKSGVSFLDDRELEMGEPRFMTNLIHDDSISTNQNYLKHLKTRRDKYGKGI